MVIGSCGRDCATDTCGSCDIDDLPLYEIKPKIIKTYKVLDDEVLAALQGLCAAVRRTNDHVEWFPFIATLLEADTRGAFTKQPRS